MLQRREWPCRSHRAVVLRGGQGTVQLYQGLSTSEVLYNVGSLFVHLTLNI